MSDFKFLHLADVHLDTTFHSRKAAVRERLKEDIRVSFQQGIDHAIENELHAVLIAGDLFDGAFLSLKTERFLVDQVNRLASAGITTVYATGNHDYAGNIGRIGEAIWPERFHLISGPEPRSIEISTGDGHHRATVIAAGHAGPRIAANLAASFPAADERDTTVGLLHAHVATAGGVAMHDRYAPCSVEDLDKRGYDYWALGHVHTRQSVSDTSEVWYAGNVQGRHSGETGAKGGLTVTIEETGVVRISFLDLAPTRWEVLHLDDLHAVTELEELSARARKAYRTLKEADEAGRDYILRVVLSGPCPFAAILKEEGQREELAEMLTDELGALDVEVKLEGLTPLLDVEAHRGQPHVLSEALALIERLPDEPELWSSLPLGALAADPEDRMAYLTSQLHGLDRELVDRMQHEED